MSVVNSMNFAELLRSGGSLTPEFIEHWEIEHGVIQSGSWVLMRTDWSQRTGADYLNLREDGAHTPGPTADAIRLLVEQRDIVGFGTETVGTDAGLGAHLSPPYPAHYLASVDPCYRLP